MPEQSSALGTLDVAGEPERIIPAEQARQPRAALQERHGAQILAFEAEEVEGDQARVPAAPRGQKGVEVRPAVREQAHRLAIQDDALHRQALDGFHDPRKSVGPVPAAAGPQARHAACAVS